MSEPNTTELKKKRIRKRSAALQLQKALDDATQPDLSIASMKLIAARIMALSKLAARDRQRRLERANQELAGVKAENEQLRRQHQEDVEELERLRTTRHDDEIAQALKKFRGENGNTNQEQVAHCT